MIWMIALYVASITYSIIRYVVFDPKNLHNIPLFVTNKGVAMAAAICFTIAFVLQLRGRSRTAVDAGAGGASASPSSGWFRAGIFGAIWHVPMALAILEPTYFKEFFLTPTGDAAVRMSLAGELVFCFGGLAAGGFYLVTRQNVSALQRWWLSVGAMLALQTHVLAMGYCRGLNINAKHGYLPPMWLLSAIAIAIGLVVLLTMKPKSTQT
jgi:hypothetical protein